MPFYEPRNVPLPSCFAAEDCPRDHGELKRCHSFPGYITFSMAKAYTEAYAHDDIERSSDVQEDILGLGMVCEDPALQVWPDTDEELDLGVNVGNYGNELTSTYFQKPCEHLCAQPPISGGADSAIVRKPVAWADMEDEVSFEVHTPRAHSPTRLQQEASAGFGGAGDAIDVPSADVLGYPCDAEVSSRTQPLLLNLESALSASFAPQGATGRHAQSYPSSWLPNLLERASAQMLTRPDTPHSCTSVSVQSTMATPLSRAFPMCSASFESETATPQSQAKVTSFKMQGTPTGEGLIFHADDSLSCLGASVPNRRVPSAAGPHDQTAKKATNAKAPGASSTSTRSTMQEGKAIGALALKKARSMLPAVNLKPSAEPATSPLQPASSSPPSVEGHMKSTTMDGAEAVKRPLPTLLQSRQGHGMVKSKWSPGQEKTGEIGVAN